MRVRGLDYSYDWKNIDLDAVVSGGYSFVMRYLTWPYDGRDAKKLTTSEVASITSRKILLGANWEYKVGDQLLGASGGRIDATEAVRQAKLLGYPEGCAIYFSTDFNLPDKQPVVDAYMIEAKKICHANGYLCGQYGSYGVIKHSLDNGICDVAWQTYGWSSGRWDSRAAIRQVLNNQRFAGGAVDFNELHNEPYLWKYC